MPDLFDQIGLWLSGNGALRVAFWAGVVLSVLALFVQLSRHAREYLWVALKQLGSDILSFTPDGWKKRFPTCEWLQGSIWDTRATRWRDHIATYLKLKRVTEVPTLFDQAAADPGDTTKQDAAKKAPAASRGGREVVDSVPGEPLKGEIAMMAVALAFFVGILALFSAALAQPGTQITISQPAEATTMDPGRSTQVLTVNYFINLYDTLTRWDGALKLQPGLATSWKQVSDTAWDFTLRPGVKFHDGTPLTAEDVKATLDRNLVPGKTVVTAGFTTIESVSIVNPSTIRIVSQKPDPLLLVRVAQMGAQILPARLTTDDGVKELARRPVGTGAYKLVEWVKDERLVMEANREWWGWEGRKPTIDRVIWKPIPEDFPRLVALEKGDVDIITNVPPDRSPDLAAGRNTRLLSVPSTRIVTFGMNSTQPPLSDKRVRQALQYAVDVNAIIKNLYAGQGKPIAGGVADVDFGHNPAIKPYPYDPARARRLLADAGLPGGVDVTLYAGTGTMVNDKALLEVIASMWSKVGIRGRVEMMEMGARARMLNERTVPPSGMLLGNPQSTLLDADGSLWRIWNPNGFNGKYWIGSQPGQRFHDLMEEARYTLDAKKRRALYAEAIEIRDAEKPSLDLFQEMVVYGTSKRVSFKPRADYRLIIAEMALAGR